MAILKHLILYPKAGLGNRLQSICCAKRLQSMFGFRLTIYWDWGDFNKLFEPELSLDLVSTIPSNAQISYRQVKHGLLIGNRGQRVPMMQDKAIILTSAHTYRAEEEADGIDFDLTEFLPKPSWIIRDKVAKFRRKYFKKTVGMHIRRTDLKVANQESPDELFIAEAHRLIDQGYTIFLATDNALTEAMMKEKFQDKIITYPKNPSLRKRWPRSEFVYEETVDDLVDLHLLAASEFVVGPFGSSFTRLAMLYNGSDRCKILKRTGLEIIPYMKPTLEHLILMLRPGAGLCVRLQAICAARRLQSMYGFRLTLCWDWGDFYDLFERESSLDCIQSIPPETKSSYQWIDHGAPGDRGHRVPVMQGKKIILATNHTFRAEEEVTDIPLGLHRFLPVPIKQIRDKVAAFKRMHFTRTVGMHIRRTDLKVANQESPDELFVAEAEKLIAEGYTIFLATDNADTEAMMKEKFGNSIITYPKNPNLKFRAPRLQFIFEETVDDLVDLQLLAASEFIIGPYGSSFTRMAFFYNGSKLCRMLRRRPSV